MEIHSHKQENCQRWTLEWTDPTKEKPFVWPSRLIDWHNKFQQGSQSSTQEAQDVIILKKGDDLNHLVSKRCEFFIHNLSGQTIEVHWVNFEGALAQPVLFVTKIIPK